MIESFGRNLNGEWHNLSNEQQLWLIFKTKQAVEEVKGTCMSSLEATAWVGEDFESHFGQIELGDTVEDLFYLICAEQEIERCDCCAWWVPSYEMNSTSVCNECESTEGEDE